MLVCTDTIPPRCREVDEFTSAEDQQRAYRELMEEHFREGGSAQVLAPQPGLPTQTSGYTVIPQEGEFQHVAPLPGYWGDTPPDVATGLARGGGGLGAVLALGLAALVLVGMQPRRR